MLTAEGSDADAALIHLEVGSILHSRWLVLWGYGKGRVLGMGRRTSLVDPRRVTAGLVVLGRVEP